MKAISLDRVLKVVNTLIAAAVLAVGFAVYWIAYRPLPTVSGTVSAFLPGEATAARDSLGVAHIAAATDVDAFFVQGYVTAQDRLWQMDTLRRAPAGEVSEILGPAGIEADREARRFRLARIAEAAALTLPKAERAAFAAYARGVNAFMGTHTGRLPWEFTVLQYSPRPWTIADSILVGIQMYRSLTTSWRDEIQKREMLRAGDPAKVNFLLPVRAGGEVQPGSNAWAISGALTASGKPLLADDMHLEYTMPGVWYIVHLKSAEGLNVSGVSLPGMPGVIVGHNERIAWGVTNLHYDVQDLYQERIDQVSGRYEFRGQVEQARIETDLIRVKGRGSIEVRNWVTRHGPLVIAGEKETLALRWTAAEPGFFQFPFLDINRAKNWEEFTAALARFPGPGQNFVYADTGGNIGYHAAGRLPIRKGYNGDVPADGASGDFEWQGFIPFEQLPSAYNPAGGMIVTANQNPFPAGYPYPVNGNFAPPYRSTQIRALLSAKKGWRAEDMLDVARDVYSQFSHFLAQAIVSAYEKRNASNPALTEAVQLLRQWNGQMAKDQAAPLLVTLSFQHLRKAVAESASRGSPVAYENPASTAVVEKLLRERPAGWLRDYDEALVRAFSDAVEEGSRIQGRDVKRWRYGNYIELTIPHPVGRLLPWIGKYFGIGPVTQSGSQTTVKQTTRRLGPSMRMAVDLGDLENSLLNVATGQSGQILSSHYKDQWPGHYAGTSQPMPFGRITAKNTLRFVPDAK